MKQLEKNEPGMYALYELMDLLPSGFIPDFASRLNKLYAFLKKNEPMGRRAAAEKYLGTADKVKYFDKLRLELTTALNRYHIASPSWASNPDKALYEECYRKFAMYRILLLNSKRKAGIRIAEKLLPDLQKIELHAFAQIVTNDLLIHYSTFEIKPKRVQKYTELIQNQLELIELEAKVRKHYSYAVMLCNDKASYNSKIVETLIKATDATWHLLHPELHYVNRLIYAIKIYRYIVVFDYKNIIKYCNKALSSLPIKHPNIRSLKLSYMNYKIPALLASNHLDEAKSVAKNAGKLLCVGTFNWHVILLQRLIVCLHAGDYQEAYELYKAHKQKKCLYENIAEYWNIIQGYLYFLVQRGKIEPYDKERFYLGKFLNEMPMYSKDKSGNNINILIIQILVNMERNQLGRIIDRIDSLKAYVHLYMRNPETRRAKTFIDMVIKMEQASFILTAVETKTQELKDKLLKTPMKLGQNLSIEIIPFEILWEEMFAMLNDRNKPKTRKKINI